MDNDGYYTFKVHFSGNSYYTEDIRAVDIEYTYTHIVFRDHVRDTLVAIKADRVVTVRRVIPNG